MKNILVVYWSGTGNTEKMANFIGKGISSGGANPIVESVSNVDANKIDKFEVIALGCPSMGNEVLEESEMEPFVESIAQKVNGKKVALFGSYGWGDGQWMRDWVDRMESYGADVIENGLTINNEPDKDGEEECITLGKELAKN